mmetsp:Transcript_35907/g.81022  ORF Transcript_35907/g.81022 Transcript_35907/m.81022 type:complete len:263 (-) Transcript_35907:248-1036(-)
MGCNGQPAGARPFSHALASSQRRCCLRGRRGDLESSGARRRREATSASRHLGLHLHVLLVHHHHLLVLGGVGHCTRLGYRLLALCLFLLARLLVSARRRCLCLLQGLCDLFRRTNPGLGLGLGRWGLLDGGLGRSTPSEETVPIVVASDVGGLGWAGGCHFLLLIILVCRLHRPVLRRSVPVGLRRLRRLGLLCLLLLRRRLRLVHLQRLLLQLLLELERPRAQLLPSALSEMLLEISSALGPVVLRPHGVLVGVLVLSDGS